MTSTAATASSTDTWHTRIKAVIGPHGYDSSMRRSLQTCILYEAKRIVLPKLDMLKPYQRKFAFMDQAKALLQSIDFVPDHERNEIFYRTKCSMEMMQPDVAWKRAHLIDKELETLAEQIKPFCAPDRTHEQAVNSLVRDLFVSLDMRKVVIV